MEFGVCFTIPATPSLFFPAKPLTGQRTDEFAPTLVFQVELILHRYSVQMKVVPLPSERCTTIISSSGSFTPWLAAASLGSFHFLMSPKKIPAKASCVNFKSAATPETL